MDEINDNPGKKSLSGLIGTVIPISDVFGSTGSSKETIASDQECTANFCSGEYISLCVTCQEDSPTTFDCNTGKTRIPGTFKSFQLCQRCSDAHHFGHQLISKDTVYVNVVWIYRDLFYIIYYINTSFPYL